MLRQSPFRNTPCQVKVEGLESQQEHLERSSVDGGLGDSRGQRAGAAVRHRPRRPPPSPSFNPGSGGAVRAPPGLRVSQHLESTQGARRLGGDDAGATDSHSTGAATTAWELATLLANKIAKYKIPKEFILADSLPRTAYGKVVEGELAARCESGRGSGSGTEGNEVNDGKVLAHRVDGGGEPLLLLNGAMMTIASWEPMAQAFAGRFSVVRCDFRGQLLTGGAARTTVEENAADVAALLVALGVPAAHVIGTSFGGAVALALAALEPVRVRSLVAATITPTTDALRREAAALRRATAEVLAGGDPGLMADRTLPVFYSPEYLETHRAELGARRGQFAALPRWWFAAADAILASLGRFDLAPYLPRIACPMLVLAAERDRIMPLERARAMAAAIPDARLVVVEGSGHVLVVEQPDRFVHECLAFLASVEVPS